MHDSGKPAGSDSAGDAVTDSNLAQEPPGIDFMPNMARAAYLEHVILPWTERLAPRVPLVCSVVHNVLHTEEADALRAFIEKKLDPPIGDSSKSFIAHGIGRWKLANNPSRKGLIGQVSLPWLQQELWGRVKNFIPAEFKDKHASGLNKSLRFLKYEPGQFFAPHQDGSQTNGGKENGSWESSLLSLLLYLSDPTGADFNGGTRFISPDCATKNETGHCNGACDQCINAPVRKGSVLLFAHSVLHAGTMSEAEKFIMRTDVMYKHV